MNLIFRLSFKFLAISQFENFTILYLIFNFFKKKYFVINFDFKRIAFYFYYAYYIYCFLTSLAKSKVWFSLKIQIIKYFQNWKDWTNQNYFTVSVRSFLLFRSFIFKFYENYQWIRRCTALSKIFKIVRSQTSWWF